MKLITREWFTFAQKDLAGCEKLLGDDFLTNIVESRLGFELDLEMIKKLNELYIDVRYPGEFGLLPYGALMASLQQKTPESFMNLRRIPLKR